jgi:hypothetical protein
VHETQNLPIARSSRFDSERRHQSSQPLTAIDLTGRVTPSVTPAPAFALSPPDCLNLIDDTGRRYLWPMWPGSSWQHELALAQVFYRQHAGVEIVTAVGR